MILCLDVGNSQIYGGVYDESNNLKVTFRKTSSAGVSSDELGVFLRSVLRENDIETSNIRHISVCSVVPAIVHSVRNACKKYFGINPFFLQPGVKTGLRIKYRNPLEVGSDRIANAIAATDLMPNENLIIIDFGTATTLCAVNKNKEYLGGVILAGIRISMEALELKTAKLPTVEILKPASVLGRSTVESIQSGLYYGHLGQIREICNLISKSNFELQKPKVLGTGGFSSLYRNSELFDKIEPNLVFDGLLKALQLNT